jgi:sugar/nucleoside kinase (ribokinase family)
VEKMKVLVFGSLNHIVIPVETVRSLVPGVDAAGTRDTFAGYFIAARYRNHFLTEAPRFARKASSVAVSRMGAMESISFVREVF